MWVIVQVENASTCVAEEADMRVFHQESFIFPLTSPKLVGESEFIFINFFLFCGKSNLSRHILLLAAPYIPL